MLSGRKLLSTSSLHTLTALLTLITINFWPGTLASHRNPFSLKSVAGSDWFPDEHFSNRCTHCFNFSHFSIHLSRLFPSFIYLFVFFSFLSFPLKASFIKICIMLSIDSACDASHLPYLLCYQGPFDLWWSAASQKLFLRICKIFCTLSWIYLNSHMFTPAVERNFSKFSGKNLEVVIFYLSANPAEPHV